MDFNRPSHLEPILDQVRAFVQQELIPLESAFLNGEFRDLLPTLAEKRQQVKDLGLWAPWLPSEYGGMGLTLAEYAHVSEELGRCPLGPYVFNCQAPDVGNMEVLMMYGTPEQKAQWLEPLARGDIRSCFCMTEPENPGSNPVLMDATAVREGDDFVLNGHKWFSTAADGAAIAIVMVITEPDAGLSPCAQYFDHGRGRQRPSQPCRGAV
jgi:acyl-CoA dehydrogenase